MHVCVDVRMDGNVRRRSTTMHGKLKPEKKKKQVPMSWFSLIAVVLVFTASIQCVSLYTPTAYSLHVCMNLHRRDSNSIIFVCIPHIFESKDFENNLSKRLHIFGISTNIRVIMMRKSMEN